jgi:hypothetical protein
MCCSCKAECCTATWRDVGLYALVQLLTVLFLGWLLS